ncbi:MAG: DUF1292 domain-containing protein [Lachnospiraceae bacterium]|nr:DUF1292 domain-containing protein [Lachnospiraceae bacterium]
MERISFIKDDGESVGFFVVAQAKIGETEYLLVTEEEEGDADAVILKKVGEDSDTTDNIYEAVDDDDELEKAAEALSELLDGVELV